MAMARRLIALIRISLGRRRRRGFLDLRIRA